MRATRTGRLSTRVPPEASGDTHRVLELGYRLYALTTLEERRGWYLEEGLFDGGLSKAIRT